MMTRFLPVLVLLGGANVACRGDSFPTVELTPTPAAVGIEVSYPPGDNQDVTARFSWRRRGETKWRDGVDMTADRKRRLFHASIWPLEQGETLDVQVTVQGPQGGPKQIEASATTLRFILQPTGGREFCVSPSGDDKAAGTRAQPWRTLAHAATLVRPGDIVYVLSGVYAEANLFKGLKGTAEKPIVFAAAPGEKPVLDSSLAIAKGNGLWKKHAGNVWMTEAPALTSPGYLSQDGLRMFRYGTLAELQADVLKQKRAWFHDAKTGRLYILPGTSSDANAHAYQLARHEYGIYLGGSEHVVVRGFTLRNYGNVAVRLSEGTHHCVLVENVIHNVPSGVFLKGETTRFNSIWKNEIFEPGLADFTWTAIKNSEYPRQGIFAVAGRGTSICHNRIHGWFDCICPESWRNPERLELNRDGDVMFNDLYNAGDDAIEADGGGVNLRLHGNRIRNCHTALSLAPVERGPVYCTRNDASFKGLMFKLNVSGCTSLGWAYCYHNSGWCLTGEGDGGTAISFPPGIPCANKVFLNNALIGNEWSVRAGQKGYTLDHNCYFHVPSKPPRKFQWEKKVYPTIDAFRKATGQEAHGLYADPLFVACPNLGRFVARDGAVNRLSDDPLVADTKPGDLRLKAGSPCIDRGAVIRGFNDDFHGKAPDIGAHEQLSHR